MAELTFTFGTVRSGKSTELIATARELASQRLPAAVIKPAADTRGGDHVFSRLGLLWPADILLTPSTDITGEIARHISDKGIRTLSRVLVDECELLTPGQVDQLHALTRQGTPVTAYGLVNDFQAQLFEGSKRFFEVADILGRLTTTCQCGQEAEFNGRKIGDDFVFEGDLIAVEGQHDVSYEPLCGGCYVQNRYLPARGSQ